MRIIVYETQGYRGRSIESRMNLPEGQDAMKYFAEYVRRAKKISRAKFRFIRVEEWLIDNGAPGWVST